VFIAGSPNPKNAQDGGSKKAMVWEGAQGAVAKGGELNVNEHMGLHLTRLKDERGKSEKAVEDNHKNGKKLVKIGT